MKKAISCCVALVAYIALIGALLAGIAAGGLIAWMIERENSDPNP